MIAPDAKAELVMFLEGRGFEETDSHTKQWFYDAEVIEYKNDSRPNSPLASICW